MAQRPLDDHGERPRPTAAYLRKLAHDRRSVGLSHSLQCRHGLLRHGLQNDLVRDGKALPQWQRQAKREHAARPADAAAVGMNTAAQLLGGSQRQRGIIGLEDVDRTGFEGFQQIGRGAGCALRHGAEGFERLQ
jgi:hypothetical protein